jgi:hypothetical protein
VPERTTQAQCFVELAQPFSEAETGEVELHREKARSGGLPHSHRVAVGDPRFFYDESRDREPRAALPL